MKPPELHGRRVSVLGVDVGRALRVADVQEYLRRAGLPDADVHDPQLVEWRGGGPETWTCRGVSAAGRRRPASGSGPLAGPS